MAALGRAPIVELLLERLARVTVHTASRFSVCFAQSCELLARPAAAIKGALPAAHLKRERERESRREAMIDQVAVATVPRPPRLIDSGWRRRRT